MTPTMLDTIPAEITAQADAAQTEALAVEEQTTALTIVTEPDYLAASETVKDLKARAKAIEAKRVELTQPLNETLRKINELFKTPYGRILAAADRIGRAMVAYQDVQAQKRREAERLAQEAARKEQARLEKLALERAQRAEARGDIEKADAILAEVPVVVPAPVVSVPAPPPVKGLTTKSYWRAEVTDLAALVTACASGDVPLEAVLPNEKLLGQTARALKGALRWPGVRVYEDRGLAGTGR